MLSVCVIVTLEGSKMTKYRCFCIFSKFATTVQYNAKLFIPIDSWEQGLSYGAFTFGVKAVCQEICAMFGLYIPQNIGVRLEKSAFKNSRVFQIFEGLSLYGDRTTHDL